MTVGSSAVEAGILLAHQGGWDEILMVLTPIALFAALLWLANSRATRLQHQQRTTSAADEPLAPDADDEPPPSEDG